jgi:hypothetical protein
MLLVLSVLQHDVFKLYEKFLSIHACLRHWWSSYIIARLRALVLLAWFSCAYCSFNMTCLQSHHPLCSDPPSMVVKVSGVAVHMLIK